ncbi:1-deoxy-D-xylulose-5-phosphate reductoisomerase [Candidatus Omnitrophota bacterium]
MRRIAILGSTGSIGQNALRVISGLGRGLRVVALSAYSDSACLLRQARRFRPEYVCLVDESAARKARQGLASSYKVFSGQSGLEDLIQASNADTVVMAISGSKALVPLIKAIKCKKTIILANKESLVIAGSIIMQLARRHGVSILPVDSEQSAIWQCLEGREKAQIRRVYLTASGGPFRNYNSRQMSRITIKEVLAHPRWRMGRRITVDSGTLMNKGLEIIEAMWLFDLELDQIEVVIHPEAIIHSMVEFLDGIILAQLSITDMRIPIQYALTYPGRLENKLKPLDFFKLKKLNFHKPDRKKFPCLGLAIEAAAEGGSLPCVLNAADEVATEAFLNRRIKFVEIPRIIKRVIVRHRKIGNPDLETILACDSWARSEAKRIIKN